MHRVAFVKILASPKWNSNSILLLWSSFQASPKSSLRASYVSDKLIWNQAFLERTVTTLLFFLRVRGSPLTSQLSHLFGGRCHPFRTSASAQENCIFWSQIWPTKNKPCSFFPKSTSNKNTSVFWFPSLLTLQRWCFFSNRTQNKNIRHKPLPTSSLHRL